MRRQTRIPSAIKWLLNERATLAGEAKRLPVTISKLATRQRELEHLLASCTERLRLAQARQATVAGAIAGLDRTLAQLDDRIDPGAGGTVNAWLEKYGQRGRVGTFVLETLASACPAPVSTSALVAAAIERFGQVFYSKQDRRDFHGHLRERCRKMELAGLVRAADVTDAKGNTYWLLGPEVLSLSELADQVKET